MGALQLKTVIYVTHQMEFLPSADVILVGHFFSASIAFSEIKNNINEKMFILSLSSTT